MKAKRWFSPLSVLVMLALLAGLALEGSAQAQEPAASPLGTVFTYQGQLKRNGNPYEGRCDFRFGLWDSLSGGTQIGPPLDNLTASVSQGYFTASLDWGPAAFAGDRRWLDIQVRCPAGSGSWVPLTPRQELTAAPYALYARRTGNTWLLTGNYGTTPGTNFVGTTDDKALVFKVGGSQAFRLEPNDNSPNVIGGYSANSVSSGVWGATIGGGGRSGYPNRVTDLVGTVGGGYGNLAGNNAGTIDDAQAATVSGGYGNAATGSSSTVAGGAANSAGGLYATVPGGANNAAGGAYSFAAGRRAKATYAGSFVWADSTDADFLAVRNNSFNVRASGGVQVLTDVDGGDGMVVDNSAHNTNGVALRVTGNSIPWAAAVVANNQGTAAGLSAESNGLYAANFFGVITAEGCDGCARLVQFALNDGTTALQAGDLAAVSGLSDPLVGNSVPILRVHRAAPGGSVIGVVQARGVPSDSSTEAKTRLSLVRAAGDAQPGDYLFLVVYGLAQVKVDASGGAVAAGARLTAAAQSGYARALQTRVLDGMEVAEGAPSVGIALEPLDSGTGLISVFVTLH